VGSLNDFADVERGRQQAFALARTRWLGGIVKPLQRLGITADHVTLFGLLLLIPYACFFTSRPGLAVAFLLASVLLDGVDGVYARVTGTASEGGALTDVCADHVGMVATVLLIIHHGLANAVAAAYYAVIYVAVVALLRPAELLGRAGPGRHPHEIPSICSMRFGRSRDGTAFSRCSSSSPRR